MYHLLDISFIIFHSLLILVNLFGWIWKPTRKINFITLILTGGSWFILGIFYGWGYCPLTDWHFRVLIRLGNYDLPSSYVKYLFDRITGADVNAAFIDNATVSLYFIALLISVYVNFIKQRKG